MIENSSIQLLKPDLSHAPQIHEAIEDSRHELRVFLPWVPDEITRSFVVNSIQEAIENYENFHNELRFSIWENRSHQFLGMISLIIRDLSVPFFEIGYWLRSSAVGCGFMSQAVRLLEKYAFETFHAKRIEIKAAIENAKSCAVAERCGYLREGVLRNARILTSGQVSHTVIYGKTDLELSEA